MRSKHRIICFLLLLGQFDLNAQCTLFDCSINGPIFNVNPPIFADNTFTFNLIEIGDIYCDSSSDGIYVGMFIDIFELLPNGETVSNCGSFLDPPDNFLGSVPLGFGTGSGCDDALILFDSENPFTISPLEGLPECDGAVFEVRLTLFVDPTGTLTASSNPVSDLSSLENDQYMTLVFGPYHNSLSGTFPSDGNGGPLTINVLENWSTFQSGNTSGGRWELSCEEDIELYVRGTSFLSQCEEDNITSGLASELTNTFTYSINEMTEVDILGEAGLPSSGGCITGVDPALGFCYGGIFTEEMPSLIPASVINPSPGDSVSVTLTTSDLFTGEIQTTNVVITFTDCNTLPINLLNFFGEAKDKYNYLEWVTASELENAFFTIQKSFNGKEFMDISQVSGSGTSIEVNTYSYFDYSNIDNSFYRIKQTDYDGNYSYSKIIHLEKVNLDQDVWMVHFAQNSAKVSITLNIELSKINGLSLHNINGQRLANLHENGMLNQNNLDISTYKFSSGIYYLYLETDEINSTKKIIIK